VRKAYPYGLRTVPIPRRRRSTHRMQMQERNRDTASPVRHRFSFGSNRGTRAMWRLTTAVPRLRLALCLVCVLCTVRCATFGFDLPETVAERSALADTQPYVILITHYHTLCSMLTRSVSYLLKKRLAKYDSRAQPLLTLAIRTACHYICTSKSPQYCQPRPKTTKHSSYFSTLSAFTSTPSTD